MAQDNTTHTVMTKKLAQALMESGMQHFSIGGALAEPFVTQNNYQAPTPTIHQQDFQPYIGDLKNRSDSIYGQQQNLANTLLQQSQGQGPNVAQSQLAQNTGNNASTQGALMASQRGASSNPALIARQAAQQGGAMQQQATGQAATLQAQQQLSAQQALAQQQAEMAGSTQAGQNTWQQANAAQNSAITQGSLGQSQLNAQASAQNAQNMNATTGGIMGSIGSALQGGGLFARGGAVKKMAYGGDIGIPDMSYSIPGGISAAGDLSKSQSGGDKKKKPPGEGPSTLGEATPWEIGGGLAGGPGDAGGVTSGLGTMLAYRGGGVPHYDDGGGISAFGQPSSGGKGGGMSSIMSMLPMLAMAAKSGGTVPGQAKVKGDSKQNDVVPALLSPGEEVIDRETLADKGPIGKAARMVAAHINAKKKDGGDDDDQQAKGEFLKHLKNKKAGYGNVIEARRACGGGRM